MATLQRQLVNLEMLADDLSALALKSHWTAVHIKLIEAYQIALQHLLSSMSSEAEHEFKRRIETSALAQVIESKRMLSVHLKLIGYILTYWDASEKAAEILESNFTEQADKRLELLQVKAIRAKSQLKTVATAMGEADYQKFINLLNLSDAQWQWQVLVARY